MTYHLFAAIYDQLMEHAPYDKWVLFTEKLINRKSSKGKEIVDLGCGTGEITIRLAHLGYTMTGVDMSTHMLSKASQKAFTNNVHIDWIQQDIRQLEGFTDIDIFISYCDVMNYITDKNELCEVFERIQKSLSSNGLFIFDIHSLYYAQEFLMDRTFADETEALAYIWHCQSGEKMGEMEHFLTFFQKVEENGNNYVRFDEVHHQQTYEINIYEQLLKSCGFTKIEFYSDFSFKNNILEKNSERIFIVAQK